MACQCTGNDPRDGLHICDCGRETKLTLWKGEHPFDKVSCPTCGQIPDALSRLSNVMIPSIDPILRFAVVPAYPNFEDKEIQYGSTCPRCGLTHRAVMKDADTDHHGRIMLTLDFGKITCLCGSRPGEGWVQFYIGSPREYHRDPITVNRDMSARNAEFAVGRLTRRHPQIDALRYMPLCAMGNMIYRANDHMNKFARFSKVQNVITACTKIFKSLGKNDGRLVTIQ